MVWYLKGLVFVMLNFEVVLGNVIDFIVNV